MFSLGSSVRRY